MTSLGFDRKELRGKLALAITANFINYYTRDEAAVDEISGVAFIFNQKFFKVYTCGFCVCVCVCVCAHVYACVVCVCVCLSGHC